jgi:hypothetical protein
MLEASDVLMGCPVKSHFLKSLLVDVTIVTVILHEESVHCSVCRFYKLPQETRLPIYAVLPAELKEPKHYSWFPVVWGC